MVNATVDRLGQQAENALSDRDVAGLATVGVAAAGGVVVSQMVADVVLDAAGMAGDPQDLTEYAISVGSKGVVALAFGYLAASTGGLALLAAAFMGIGSLASAGTDVIEFLLTQDPLGGSAPRQTASTASRSSRSVSPSASSGSSGGQTADNPF